MKTYALLAGVLFLWVLPLFPASHSPQVLPKNDSSLQRISDVDFLVLEDTQELDVLRFKAQLRANRAWTYFLISIPIFLLTFLFFGSLAGAYPLILGIGGFILIVASFINMVIGFFHLGRLRARLKRYKSEVQEKYRKPSRNLLISLIGVALLLSPWTIWLAWF